MEVGKEEEFLKQITNEGQDRFLATVIQVMIETDLAHATVRVTGVSTVWRAPMLLPVATEGSRAEHGEVVDESVDGLLNCDSSVHIGIQLSTSPGCLFRLVKVKVNRLGGRIDRGREPSAALERVGAKFDSALTASRELVAAELAAAESALNFHRLAEMVSLLWPGPLRLGSIEQQE